MWFYIQKQAQPPNMQSIILYILKIGDEDKNRLEMENGQAKNKR